MSDFGAIILIKRKDGVELSDNEIENISTQLKTIVESGDVAEDIKGNDYLDFREWGDGALCIVLTEYYDDESIEEYYEDTKEDDLSTAKIVAENLSAGLGDEYKITFAFEHW